MFEQSNSYLHIIIERLIISCQSTEKIMPRNRFVLMSGSQKLPLFMNRRTSSRFALNIQSFSCSLSEPFAALPCTKSHWDTRGWIFASRQSAFDKNIVSAPLKKTAMLLLSRTNVGFFSSLCEDLQQLKLPPSERGLQSLLPNKLLSELRENTLMPMIVLGEHRNLSSLLAFHRQEICENVKKKKLIRKRWRTQKENNSPADSRTSTLFQTSTPHNQVVDRRRHQAATLGSESVGSLGPLWTCCNFQHGYCTFVTILFRPFAGLFVNLTMCIRALFPKPASNSPTCRTSILEGVIFHKMSYLQVPLR